MRRPDVFSALVCDDFREEISGKHILIGVYVSYIGLVTLPMQMVLTWYIQFMPKELGTGAAKIRVVDGAGKILMTGDLSIEVKELSVSALPLRMPIVLEHDGTITLEWQWGEDEWTPVGSIGVKVAPRPGDSPSEAMGSTA